MNTDSMALLACIIVFANMKGGVTKTTTTLNVAIVAFLLGKRVLIVDLDLQGNTTTALGYEASLLQHTVYTLMLGQSNFENTVKRTYFDKISKRFLDPSDEDSLQKVKQKNIVRGPDLLPCNVVAARAENDLISNPAWGSLLRQVLSSVRDQYDYIFIDTHPDLGKLTVNGFIAADIVVIPSVPEKWPTDGLITLTSSIVEAQRVNPGLQVGGIFFTRVKYGDHYDLIKFVQDNLIHRINAKYPGLNLSCFQAMSNESVSFTKSTNKGSCVVLSHPTDFISLSYWAFFAELLQKSQRSDFSIAYDQFQKLLAIYKAREEKATAKLHTEGEEDGKEQIQSV